MPKLVRIHRNATVDQITTLYDEGIENISESTRYRTLKQMSYNSRSPQEVPHFLMRTENRG